MIVSDVLLTHCLEIIEKFFSMNGIKYGLLKGAVLKKDYPKTYHRFMSD